MKIITERSDLFHALSHVHKVVERRNSIPIFNNVLLKADNDMLQLTATDLETEITDRIAIKCQQEGAVTVPVITLFDICRKLPDGAEIELETSDSRLLVNCGHSHFELPTLPVDDFPIIEGDDYNHKFTVPGDMLLEIVEKTQFAISHEETRHYLNGIYFYIHGDKNKGDKNKLLRAVATDGHRLARAEINAPVGSDAMAGIIVARKTISEIRRLMQEKMADFTIEVSQNKIRFSNNNLTLISRLIDGTFPDHNQVIPRNNDKLLKIDCEKFKNALERVSIVANDKVRAVKMILTDNSVTLKVSNVDIGSANEQLDCDYTSEEMTLGFNVRYLMDVLQQITGKDANFLLYDNKTPVVINDDGDVKALYLVMPMFV